MTWWNQIGMYYVETNRIWTYSMRHTQKDCFHCGHNQCTLFWWCEITAKWHYLVPNPVNFSGIYIIGKNEVRRNKYKFVRYINFSFPKKLIRKSTFTHYWNITVEVKLTLPWMFYFLSLYYHWLLDLIHVIGRSEIQINVCHEYVWDSAEFHIMFTYK